MIHQSTGKKNNLILLIITFLFLNTINFKHESLIFSNIKEIKVIGLENHLNSSIQNKLNYLKDNHIFSINKKKLTQSLNQYNYIENFKVYKLYPNNILLSIKQTTFLGSTLKNNKKYLVGSNAKLIDYDLFPQYMDLPLVYGNFKPKDFILLKKQIKNSPIDFNNIKNFFFYPSQRWDIQNKNNIIIKLPNQNIDDALIMAKKIINNNNFKSDTIDLRIKNQIILSNE